MTLKEIRERDHARLETVCPPLREVVRSILTAMDVLGFPMTVTAAARTPEEQFALWCKGRKMQGSLWVPIDPVRFTGIVTWADGIVKKSNHQVAADGLGRAIDAAFLVDGPDADDIPDTPSWDEKHPWELYGEMGKALGHGRVEWGGDWKKPHDAPHLGWRD